MEPLRMFYQSKVELALRSDLGKQASDFDDVGNQLEQAFPNRLEGPHRAAHTSSGSHSLPAAGRPIAASRTTAYPLQTQCSP